MNLQQKWKDTLHSMRLYKAKGQEIQLTCQKNENFHPSP
jgi:hypothetical protein